MTWIRVEANLAGKRVVGRLAQILGAALAHFDARQGIERRLYFRTLASGMVVALWCQMAEHCDSHHPDEITDIQIEDWADWYGPPGAFATFVRAHWLELSQHVRFNRREIPVAVQRAVVARDGQHCRHCGRIVRSASGPRDVAPDTRQLDHLTPVVRGGGNQPDNLVVSCRLCNARRGANASPLIA